jgi:hypothetical protein
VQHYRYKDRPVWAFKSAGGCLSFGSSPIPEAIDRGCIDWTFLDPSDAAELDETDQTYPTPTGLP